MICRQVDVAVVGSGFGGSVMAMLLARIGLSCILIDRAGHPRFAIGESSTPNADLVLMQIAEQYDLPRLAPLARYGTWQQHYPHVVCGIKRGFSYFHHRSDEPFVPTADHANELLVAASPDDFHSDTHWLRADVDAFLAGEAQALGVPLLDHTDVALATGPLGWRLAGSRREEAVQIDARFVIDATGDYGLVPRTLGIRSRLDGLATNSRAIFAHFRGLKPWHDSLVDSGASVHDHPFYCDHAALHHVIDEGWMYQLGFNNGVTSAGFVLDADEHPLDESVPVECEWNCLLSRYPAIGEQFCDATIVAPAGGLVRTRRLQRRQSQMAGENWALLPHTGGFIDPLHSTGIAQTLCGIQRLVAVLHQHWNRSSLAAALNRYSASLGFELEMIDRLVSACYHARRNFRLFAAGTMLYFAGAHTSESRRLAGALPPGEGFLCADDLKFRRIVDDAWDRVLAMAGQSKVTDSDSESFEQYVRDAIEPWNEAGLFDASTRNMYRFTAISKH